MTTDAPSAPERVEADLLDPELYRRDPHDVWSWMRANEPVYRDARNGLWGVTRHADIVDVERRSTVFISGQGYRAIWSPEEANMIAQDDPRHRQQRMLVQRRFTKQGVAERRGDIEGLATELVDAILQGLGSGDRCEFEVVDALAGQLPARLTAQLIGYPEEMWPDIKVWSEKLMRTDMRERDGATFREFFDANMEFAGVLGEIAGQKLAEPADDLISDWLHGRIDGEPLPPESIVHEVGLFISGGAETTRTAISHGLRTFVDHPGQWDALAADPELVPGAVEEVLRWVTPLSNMFRRAIADDRIGDQPVGAGDRIILLYPSANRDEDVFDDPFTFDIRRAPNPHVAFGFGTHLCIGTHVARATLGAVFGRLAARLRDLEAVTEPDVESNMFARAVRSFTLAGTVR
ncbi:MAG: cytochrome P450 [Ilumatobacteraceae bacterium]|nr:cytochrome P450 [Ilumatobacteraceae bacterium]